MKTPEEHQYHLRPRPAENVTLSIPVDTLNSLKQVAAERDMSVKALLKFYVGQNLRQDLARRFRDETLQESGSQPDDSQVLKSTKSKIIYCDTPGKQQILKILLSFDKRGTRDDFKQEKYQCVRRLADCSKIDLEASKADIEYYIDSSRTLAAVLASFAAIISVWLSMGETGRIAAVASQVLIVFVSILFASLGAFLHFGVGGKASWLHIVKMAIIYKSKDEAQKQQDLSSYLRAELNDIKEIQTQIETHLNRVR